MRTLLVPLFSAGLATIAPTQSETSPKGYLTTEGNASAESLFGYNTAAYGYGDSYLHVDATNLGQARTLKALSMRRDGNLASNPAYVARTVKFGIRMAHVDFAKVKGNTPQNDSEFLLTPWSMVMVDKNVSLPSLVQRPTSPTAPFSVLLQLDSNFAYNGTDALCFQILSSPNSDLVVNFSDYPVDYSSNNPAIAAQSNFGTGCVATGNSSAMRHNSYLMSWGPNSSTHWDLGTTNAPANAAIVTVLGLSNPSLTLGACEKLYAQPDITLSAVTNNTGTLFQALKFPHKPELIGAKVYSQSAAYDAGKAPLPLALSQGMRVVYPADPVLPAITTASQLVQWSNPAWPTSHTCYPGSAVIFGLHD